MFAAPSEDLNVQAAQIWAAIRNEAKIHEDEGFIDHYGNNRVRSGGRLEEMLATVAEIQASRLEPSIPIQLQTNHRLLARIWIAALRDAERMSWMILAAASNYRKVPLRVEDVLLEFEHTLLFSVDVIPPELPRVLPLDTFTHPYSQGGSAAMLLYSRDRLALPMMDIIFGLLTERLSEDRARAYVARSPWFRRLREELPALSQVYSSDTPNFIRDWANAAVVGGQDQLGRAIWQELQQGRAGVPAPAPSSSPARHLFSRDTITPLSFRTWMQVLSVPELHALQTLEINYGTENPLFAAIEALLVLYGPMLGRDFRSLLGNLNPPPPYFVGVGLPNSRQAQLELPTTDAAMRRVTDAVNQGVIVPLPTSAASIAPNPNRPAPFQPAVVFFSAWGEIRPEPRDQDWQVRLNDVHLNRQELNRVLVGLDLLMTKTQLRGRPAGSNISLNLQWGAIQHAVDEFLNVLKVERRLQSVLRPKPASIPGDLTKLMSLYWSPYRRMSAVSTNRPRRLLSRQTVN